MNILDKEEFRVKLGQINKLVETQDYKGAMQIVDSIDWRRVKNVRTLCVVGEIYAASFRGGYVLDYGVIMLVVTISTIPMLVIFFTLQKNFVEGILGSVK